MREFKGYQVIAYALIVIVSLIGYNRLQQQKADTAIKNDQLKASVDALAAQVRSLGGDPITGSSTPSTVYAGPTTLSVVGPPGPPGVGVPGVSGHDGKDGSDGQNGSDKVIVVVVYPTPSPEPRPSPAPSPHPSYSPTPTPSPSPTDTPAPSSSPSESSEPNPLLSVLLHPKWPAHT